MSPAEKRDPVPPAAALRLLVANLTSNPVLRMTPGGPALVATLATLLEWVDATEIRLGLAEDAIGGHAVNLRTLPRQVEERLQHLLAVGSKEGQLEAPIADQARPGGPRQGDIVQPGGKGEVGPPIFCRRCGRAHYFDPALYDHPFEV